MNRAWLLAVLAVLLPAGCNEQAVQPPPAAPLAAPGPEAPSPPAAPALEESLQVDPVRSLPEDGRIVIRAHLKNPTDREIRPSVSWDATGTWWQGVKAAAAPIPPGGQGDIEIQVKVGRRLFPLPQARIEVVDGKKVLHTWDFLPQAMAPVAPTVREWHIIGPFDLGLPGPLAGEKDEKERYLKGPLPGWDAPLPAEKAVDLAAAYAGAGGRTVRWQAAAADEKGFLDLGAVRGTDYAVALAAASIHSAKEGKYDFTCGSAGSIRVRIGGKEVWKKHAIRPARSDEDFFSADLAAGWNEVRVKVAGRADGCGFYFRVLDPQDTLASAPKPETAAAGAK